MDIIYYKKKNLLELKNLKKLKWLTITSSSIVSLEGCEFLESLEKLMLYYNRSLEDISALCGNASTFDSLDIEKLRENIGLFGFGNIGKSEGTAHIRAE